MHAIAQELQMPRQVALAEKKRTRHCGARPGSASRRCGEARDHVCRRAVRCARAKQGWHGRTNPRPGFQRPDASDTCERGPVQQQHKQQDLLERRAAQLLLERDPLNLLPAAIARGDLWRIQDKVKRVGCHRRRSCLSRIVRGDLEGCVPDRDVHRDRQPERIIRHERGHQVQAHAGVAAQVDVPTYADLATVHVLIHSPHAGSNATVPAGAGLALRVHLPHFGPKSAGSGESCILHFPS